jgi:hypothetical protein
MNSTPYRPKSSLIKNNPIEDNSPVIHASTQERATPLPPPSDDIASAALIPIDGFRQIVEMLRIADPKFRESLLRRLAAKDVELARSLRQDLKDQL